MFKTNGSPETQPSTSARYRAKILTSRRIKIITSFLCMTINNPYTYGEFESAMWIDMLIELLCEPKRCRSTRADVKAWLKKDCFEGLIEQVRQVTGKLRFSMSTSRCESPCPSSETSSSEPGVPMDLSVSQSSPDEESDSTYDIYTPNLHPLYAVETMDVGNEELEPRDEPDYLDLSFSRSKATCSQGTFENAGDMAANQNQREPEVELPENSFGQQHYHVSHGENPEYFMQHGQIWNPLFSIENQRTLDRYQPGVVKMKEEVRPDHEFEQPLAIAPWLFTRQNLLLDSMEPENNAFVEANLTACAVQVKTEVESDDESEYLDISYTRSATTGPEAVNLDRFQAPQYQSEEGFYSQVPMTVPSPQSNHEYQCEDQNFMEQDEVLDYSINKQVPVAVEDIPIMPSAPLCPNCEDKSTQTLPVPNDHLSRPLKANFAKSAELLSDCDKVLTSMVENIQHLENFSNGWDVVYRAISLVKATLKTTQK